MQDHTEKLAAMCSRLLGTPAEAPLKDCNGAVIAALIDAYVRLDKADRPDPGTIPQAFQDQIYSEPWSCYVIRNSVTGTAYVGSASKGFLHRYPNGQWWLHHNDRLIDDVIAFGTLAFRVQIYTCTDEADMHVTEARLMSANRRATYNIRPEQDNA